jgi:glyoxylase-like metal-dependent hydrolase (beta-lactamase superfamily II)
MMRDAAAIAVLLLAALTGGCRATLAPAPAEPLALPRPPRGAPSAVCWIETASSLGFTSASLLVKHARGDLLIDAGLSTHFDDEVADHPFAVRTRLKLVQGALRPERPLPEALAAAGEPPASVRYVVVTHAHGDHLGGLVDLPGPQALMSQEEIDFIGSWGERRTFHTSPALAKALLPRLTPIGFAPVRYETFAESADLFGDGSVVAVKLPGHTPGSIGVVVTLASGLRLFHIGDAAHDLAGVVDGKEKGLLTAATDYDKPHADATVARLHALAGLDPTLTFLPAHDRARWLEVFGGEPPRCLPAGGAPAP